MGYHAKFGSYASNYVSANNGEVASNHVPLSARAADPKVRYFL